MKLKPKGIITPIITPFTENGEINELVMRGIIRNQIENGVEGLLPMGTTGEFYAFYNNLDGLRRLLEITVEAAAGKAVVYAGCNDLTTRGTVALTKIAEKAGVDAVSILSPIFTCPKQNEIYAYFKDISEQTTLPVVMYDNKLKTGSTIEPQTVARLAELENIVGIKDTTGDFTNTEECIRLTKGNDSFSVLVGRDIMIYAGLCYGAAGKRQTVCR